MPSYHKAVYNGSLMFLNSHPYIGGSLKLPQNVINIAGYMDTLMMKSIVCMVPFFLFYTYRYIIAFLSERLEVKLVEKLKHEVINM